jgi:hypothetical protein
MPEEFSRDLRRSALVMSPLFAGIIAAATGYEQFHTLICRVEDVAADA